jgi:hypothetical protein
MRGQLGRGDSLFSFSCVSIEERILTSHPLQRYSKLKC